MGGKDKKDDLNSSTMSLGDHLEELRMRLLLALGGLVVGAVVCLLAGTKIINFIQKPYNDLASVRSTATDPNNITDPNDAAQANDSTFGKPLAALAPTDAFVGYMKVSLISGLVLSSPWVFYQLWMFIAAGLYPHERRYVHIAVPFCAALFVAGAMFFLFLVAPLSLKFLWKFGTLINVAPNWTFQSYISFMAILMLVFGLAFQTPVAIFFLNKTGLVSIRALRKSRKFVLLGAFIVGAVATPPDVITQVTLAIPLYLLYELGILLCYIASRRKKSQG